MILSGNTKVQRAGNAGSTAGATRGATFGQRPGNGGVQLSPYTPDVAPRLSGGGTSKISKGQRGTDCPSLGPSQRLPRTGNSRRVSRQTSIDPQTSCLGFCCCRLRWSSQVHGLAAAMTDTDHTFSAASLRLRRSLQTKRNNRMKDSHSPTAPIGQAIKQNRTHVIAASLALLIREMKYADTPDAVAFKVLREAPDKIEAALSRGSKALVFYRIDQDTARGIVSDQDDRLERFARSAQAEGATVLCFNPSLIATLASMVEPKIDFLIEATAGGVRYDA